MARARITRQERRLRAERLLRLLLDEREDREWWQSRCYDLARLVPPCELPIWLEPDQERDGRQLRLFDH